MRPHSSELGCSEIDSIPPSLRLCRSSTDDFIHNNQSSTLVQLSISVDGVSGAGGWRCRMRGGGGGTRTPTNRINVAAGHDVPHGGGSIWEEGKSALNGL